MAPKWSPKRSPGVLGDTQEGLHDHVDLPGRRRGNLGGGLETLWESFGNNFGSMFDEMFNRKGAQNNPKMHPKMVPGGPR